MKDFTKHREINEARKIILQEIENQHLKSLGDFNEEMLEMPTCKKIILFYESRKLEVLQMLSNPFKSGLTFGKPDAFVLELAAE